MTRRALTSACLAVLLALVVLGLQVRTVPSPYVVPEQHPLAAYAGQTLQDRIEILASEADGSSFLLVSRDLSLGDAAADFGDRDHAAYRSQRIVPALLTWMFGARPWSLALVVLFGLGAIAAALVVLLPRVPLALAAAATVLNPGSMATVEWLSSESVANGFGLWGVVAWRTGRRWPAVALWTLAVLSRDTAVLYPLVVGCTEAVRAIRAARTPVSSLAAVIAAEWPLLCVPLAYLGWGAVVHARIGSWPWGGEASGNLSLIPFGPVLRGDLGVLDRHVGPSLAVLALVGLGLAVSGRLASLTPLVLAHGLLLVVLGPLVWARWDYFARLVTLPMVVGLIVVGQAVLGWVRGQQNIRSTPPASAPIVSGG